MDINVLLFPDFEILDAFGPVEILDRVESFHLRYFSMQGGEIASYQGAVIQTESCKQLDKTGILLVPGGFGTRTLVHDTAFLAMLTELAMSSHACLTVCTGSALLAKTGILAGRKATSNKKAFDWVASLHHEVHWVRHARWVVDGKFYTSSGVSAGMDMALGFIADRFGEEQARCIAQAIEYTWHDRSDSDPFSEASLL